MKKVFLFFIFFTLSITFILMNIGNFLDVTSKPSKTDLIVSLGGHGIKRTNVALNLEKRGYLNNNTIILTGYEGTKRTKSKNIPDARLQLISNPIYNHINFIHNEKPKNTAEEVIYIKKFMKKNRLKHVTFITEKPHSRRVLLLLNILETKDDENLNYQIVESNLSYWNSKYYYKNKHSREYVFKEVIKIAYNLIAYGIFYKLGILNYFEKNIEELKPIVINSIRKIPF